jgi:hypothetical protein
MSKIISKCGIECTNCDAYKATIQNSDDLRKETAEKWSSQHGTNIDYKTINCMGCQETDNSKLFSHCNVCKVRLCANDKGYTTCAECDDYGCDNVSEIWKFDNSFKENLDSLRKK